MPKKYQFIIQSTTSQMPQMCGGRYRHVAGDRVSPTDLASIGAALYGPRWQTELARALGVSDRTIRRWVSGATAIPVGTIDRLRDIGRNRLVDVATAIPT